MKGSSEFTYVFLGETYRSSSLFRISVNVSDVILTLGWLWQAHRPPYFIKLILGWPDVFHQDPNFFQNQLLCWMKLWFTLPFFIVYKLMPIRNNHTHHLISVRGSQIHQCKPSIFTGCLCICLGFFLTTYTLSPIFPSFLTYFASKFCHQR